MIAGKWLRYKWLEMANTVPEEKQARFLIDSFALYRASPWRLVAVYGAVAVVLPSIILFGDLILGILLTILFAGALYIHILYYLSLLEVFKNKYVGAEK